jgi:hypothetical protein
VNYFKTPKDFFVFNPKFQRKQKILILLRTVLILQDKNNLISNSKEKYLISVPASYKSYKDIQAIYAYSSNINLARTWMQKVETLFF